MILFFTKQKFIVKKPILNYEADLIVKLLTIQRYLNYLKIDKKNDKSGFFFRVHITIKTTFTIFMESK